MLHIIPTPIGNKEDMTMRALRLLEEIDIFFCEDTRTARKLFRLYELDSIHKTFHALTSFSSEGRLMSYVQMMKEQNCALLSEAGTPGLSDPGKELVRLCREHEIKFEVLPGANALIPSVVGTYTDTSRFVFAGFIPAKKGRQTFLRRISDYDMPVFAYESVHRIEKLLKDLVVQEYAGNITIFRELTKLFEQKVYGRPEVLLQMIRDESLPLKGEFVICFMNDQKS